MRRTTALCLGALFTAAPLPAAAAERGGGQQAPVLFGADEVQYDEDLGLVVAKGHVELSQKDQILLADTVTYNQRTDTVTASGNVSLLQPTGEIVFGDFVELHDNMRDGFVRNVRMLLSDRSRMAGNAARRIDANRTEVRRGVYSPCEPCREDPTRAPIWQIKAEEIVHDREQQLVEYRDAVLELDGVPVLWTPYFSHPDPSVKRRSGFLSPSFGNSTSLGFHTGIPYYWVIGPEQDATFSPMFTTGAGTFLGGEYRQRFSNGKLTTDDSLTIDSKRSTVIDAQGTSGLRWHTDTQAEFDLTQDWRAGGNILRASDQTYMLRYRLPAPANFLTSNLYAENFGPRSYSNVSAWAFQSLRPGVGDTTEPIAAPVADYNWVSTPDRLGGRLALAGNALNLMRLDGINTRRLSGASEWRLPFDGAIGDRFALTVALRSDGYQSDNIPIGSSPTATQNAVAGRVFPQVALAWRYPWARRGESYDQVIEPMVMLAAAPNGGNPGTIPNEDSQGFEFDETSLFLRNRFPGLDRVDSGQRVDYGLRGGVYGDGGGSTRFVVGQSYSAQVNNNYLPGSGLEHHVSDVVGRVTVSPVAALDFTYRFRLGNDDLALRRQEIAATVGPSNLRLGVNYIQIAPISNIPDLQKRKQLSASLNAALTRYWSIQLLGTRDFARTTPTVASVGTTETLTSGAQLIYRDECVSFITSLTQSGIRNGDVVPGTSLLFTIVFKNLGDIATKVADFGNIGGL